MKNEGPSSSFVGRHRNNYRMDHSIDRNKDCW